MIAKHVAMRSVKKSDFAGLVKYISDPQEKNERVDFVSVTNCQSDDVPMAILEVTHTQSRNSRAAADKTYHLIVSFRAGENPNAETLRAIEARICEGLGFGEHQRVSALHSDTDNLHLHIAINKIHPTRLTIHTPYNDHKTLGALCERLEREYGLERDNHQAQKTGSENRAGDMERHAGVESLLGWIKRECLADLKTAQNWTEFRAVLADNGLTLMLRGNGFVVADGAGTMVKGSSIAREFSKGQLEARLGPFEPQEMTPEAAPVKQYEPRPLRVRVDTTELYARYQAEQQTRTADRAQSWAQARDRRYGLMETARRTARLKRAVIKLMGGSASTKRMLYAMTSKTLTANLDKIARQYREERTTIYSHYQRQAWADWLRSQAAKGDRGALEALRARPAAQTLNGNTVTASGDRTHAPGPANQDSITKKGTAIFTAGRAVIRDDGKRLKVSKGLNHQATYTALRMAMDRYGSHLSVTGTDEFKAQIVKVAAITQLAVTFDDAELERRRQALMTTQAKLEIPTDGRSDDRGRRNTSSVNDAGSTTTRPERELGLRRANPPAKRATPKPNVGRIGRKPPPERQNRLRNLSTLGVVRFDERSEVLLPGNVPGHLEHQGAQRTDALRRTGDQPGLAAAAWKAADTYIQERNRMRSLVLDIPEHNRYNVIVGETLVYVGQRSIDGQSLALLRKDNQIYVLPVDEATAAQLRRKLVGDAVSIRNGSVVVQPTKGRSR